MGPTFSWRGPVIGIYERIYEKLDIIFCNDRWRVSFPEGVCKVLSRLSTSNHNLIMLFLNGIDRVRGLRPFCFERMWLEHINFHDFVKAKWNGNKAMHGALSELAMELKEWNWKIFGEWKRRKSIILRRLEGIQRKRPICSSEERYLSKIE